METIDYTWKDFQDDINLGIKYLKTVTPKFTGVYGIPKGGLIPAVCLANALDLPLIQDYSKVQHNKLVLIVDDIADSGKTLSKMPNIKNHVTFCLMVREGCKFKPTFNSRHIKGKAWVIFPYEGKEKDMVRDGTKTI